MIRKKAIATIRDTRNGKVGTKEIQYLDEAEDEVIKRQWTEGEYGCDCNRAIFLYGDYSFPCGNSVFALDNLEIKEVGAYPSPAQRNQPYIRIDLKRGLICER